MKHFEDGGDKHCVFCKEIVVSSNEFYPAISLPPEDIPHDLTILNDLARCHWTCFYQWEKAQSFIDFYFSRHLNEKKRHRWPVVAMVTDNYCILAAGDHITVWFKDPPLGYRYNHDTMFKKILLASRLSYDFLPDEKAKKLRTLFLDILERKDEVTQKIKNLQDRRTEYEQSHKYDNLDLEASTIDGYHKSIKEYIMLGGDAVSYTGPAPESRITEVEKKLGVQLPDSYKWFLQTYGQLSVYEDTIFGITADEVPCVKETLKLRQEGLPGKYVVIGTQENQILCISTSDRHFSECLIHLWDGKKGIIKYTFFYGAIIDRLKTSLANEILLNDIEVIPEWIKNCYGSISIGCDEEKIAKIERVLEVQLPESYKKVLRLYGEFEVEEIPIYGVKDNKKLTCVEKTLEQRKIGLPDKSVVIYNDYNKVSFYDTSQMTNDECPIFAWKKDGTIERDSNNIINFVANQRAVGRYDYYKSRKYEEDYNYDECQNRNLALFRAEEPDNRERQKEFSEYSSELREEFYSFRLQNEIEWDIHKRVKKYLDDFKSEKPEDPDRQKKFSEYSDLLKKRFDEFAERKIQEEKELEELKRKEEEKAEEERRKNIKFDIPEEGTDEWDLYMLLGGDDGEERM